MDRFSLPEVTYLDADLYFYQSPGLLLDELHENAGSVLITQHRYAPEYDQSERLGIYCVQFMTFKSDDRGRRALLWWQQRCVEWCGAVPVDGKFGDQKYLDDWTRRFEGVHDLNHLGGGVAPWNVRQYHIMEGPSVDGVPLVFYHFHNLRWLTDGTFDLCWGGYVLGQDTTRLIYEPYLEALKEARSRVRKVDPEFEAGKHPPPQGLRPLLSHLKRRMYGTYHVVRE